MASRIIYGGGGKLKTFITTSLVSFLKINNRIKPISCKYTSPPLLLINQTSRTYSFQAQNFEDGKTVATTTKSDNSSIDFTNFKRAFKAKNSFEIIRALAVYKLCSFDFLVTQNRKLISLSRKMLGKRGFDFVMKNSFYGHFVAGETQDDIKGKLDLMQKYGVGAILDYAVEADIPKDDILSRTTDEDIEDDNSVVDLADIKHRFYRHKEFADRRDKVISARTYFYEDEEKCDRNMEVFLDCIDTTGNTAKNGFAAIKVTALGRPSLLLRLSQILNQTQYYFDQLATKNNILCERHIAEDAFLKGLSDLGVDMSEEDARGVFKIIDRSKDGSIDIFEWHNFLTPQLQLAKLFRAKPKIQGNARETVMSVLNSTELNEIENMTTRLLTIAERAKEKNVRLMVDAEQTYFQPAITRVTLEAMRAFNRERPIVFNTYQCYLKDARTNINIDIELSRREGFHFGAKLVRGAYMEQERLRAQTIGYSDPIHDTYDDTDECYNDILRIVLEEVKENAANVMVATHNQGSVRVAIDAIKNLRIKSSNEMVFFGQLLGMCDVVTYALGAAGYSAYKYVPYGPVEEVIPYLSRRAMENRSLMKGVVKERQMLWNELKRRYQNGELRHDPNVSV